MSSCTGSLHGVCTLQHLNAPTGIYKDVFIPTRQPTSPRPSVGPRHISHPDRPVNGHFSAVLSTFSVAQQDGWGQRRVQLAVQTIDEECTSVDGCLGTERAGQQISLYAPKRDHAPCARRVAHVGDAARAAGCQR